MILFFINQHDIMFQINFPCGNHCKTFTFFMNNLVDKKIDGHTDKQTDSTKVFIRFE